MLPHPQVFNDEYHRLNVYGTNVEVDYRGYEVTVENFIRVLTGGLVRPVAPLWIIASFDFDESVSLKRISILFQKSDMLSLDNPSIPGTWYYHK
jgi:hypothetical protein